MIRGLAVAPLLAIGCWGSAKPAPIARPPVMPAEPHASLLVYEDDGSIRFFGLTGPKIALVREVKLPLRPEKLDWLHGDPVVLLGLPLGGGSAADKLHDGEVGVIRSDGYHVLPAIPPSTWGPPGVDHDASVDLIVTATDEIWAGHCEWAKGDVECTDWIYARVAPGPMITTKVAPQRVKRVPPPLWVGKGVELVADPAPDDPDRRFLRCTLDGKSMEYPPADQRVGGYAGVSNLGWIRAKPPTYRVAQGMSDGITGPVWFTGCERASAGFTFVMPGPSGFTALYAGSFVEVLYRGRTVETIRPEHDGAINPRWRP